MSSTINLYENDYTERDSMEYYAAEKARREMLEYKSEVETELDDMRTAINEHKSDVDMELKKELSDMREDISAINRIADSSVETADDASATAENAVTIARGAEKSAALASTKASSAKDIADNLFVYSGKPVQIGVWIDGTPVWRTAFDFVLKGMMETSFNRDFEFEYEKDMFVINSSVFYQVEGSPDIYSVIMYYKQYMELLESDINSNVKIWGYVDFVTDSSNIVDE